MSSAFAVLDSMVRARSESSKLPNGVHDNVESSSVDEWTNLDVHRWLSSNGLAEFADLLAYTHKVFNTLSVVCKFVESQ